jgi:hypothetical protein
VACRLPRAPRWVASVAAAVLAVVGAMAFGVPAARAGQWVQVSCQNMVDGSMGNAPLIAALYGTQSQGNREILTYTPPAGSSLTGGTVVADVSDTAPSAISYIYSPVDSGNPLAFCSSPDGCDAQTNPGTMTATLPSGGGGYVYAQADCDVANSCNVASSSTVMASITIDSAELLLENDGTPGGSGFTGTALGTVSGTGQLLFTATDPNGPGVYNVTVAVDGTTVYSATPNTSNGACVQHGIYPGTTALMFDEAQPCPATEAVDIAVPTANIPNGAHTLTATVTDAAGNSATVLAQTITVDNPTTTPTPTPTPVAPVAPAKLRKIHDRLIVGWDYRHPRTRLALMRFARTAKLPAKGRVTFACAPAADCPKLKLRHPWVGVKHATKLFSALKGLRFRKGEVVQLTISAPHRRAERFVFHIHQGRAPSARVYSGTSRLPKHTAKGA